MTTRQPRRIDWLLSFSCLVCLGSTPACAAPLHIVYADDIEPLSWKENGQLRGFLVEAADLIAKRARIPVRHEALPWARAQKMLQIGQADAFVTVRTPERQQYTVCVEQPVFTASYRVFVSRTNPRLPKIIKVASADELHSFKLGSYLGSGWSKANLRGFDVDTSPSLDIALKKMLLNRIDLAVGPQEIIEYRLDKIGASGFATKLSIEFAKAEFRFCVARASPFVESIPRLSKALAEIHSNGSLSRISLKYHFSAAKP